MGGGSLSVVMATEDSARAYARIRYRLFLLDLAASGAGLGLLQVSGGSRGLAAWWSHRVTSLPLILLGYLVVFGIVYYAALLPLHWYGSFRLEHRFALSRMTMRQWWIREAKQMAVSGGVSLVLLESFYALLRAAPHRWPLYATLGWVGFSVVLTRVFPTVLLPLFYQTTPLLDDPLTQRLMALCERAGVRTLGVFRFNLGAETRKANAALAGVGTTRRVLVSDTLLKAFTPEEIEGVLAHELAHHRYRHITKTLWLSAGGSWIAFLLTERLGQRWAAALGLQGLSDVAGFPLLALWLSLLGLLSLPLQHGLARRFEWQADRFASALIARPRAFAEALRRLAQLNLADPAPPRWIVWWFYDHPPITERIGAAEAASSRS